MTIEEAIKAATGKTPITYNDYTSEWLSWYEGDVKSFHHYQVYNGQKKVACKRRTLNMAKQICEDWANLLLNEKTDVVMANYEDQVNMWKLLQGMKFWSKGNMGVEETFALGLGAFVSSVTESGEPKVQFVNRTKIYPLTVEDQEITECAFVNVGSDSAVLQIHYKDAQSGNYLIRTIYGTNTNGDLSFDIPNSQVFDTKSNRLWFMLYRPNISNNININSPMGISVYANSLDKLAGVDLAYDGFCNELNIGKGRIFVDKKLTRYGDDGETPVFDNNDTAFYTYGNGTDENKDPLKFYNPTLRVNDYFTGVNRALALLSSAVGFGENRYRFDGAGISTATQIVSENSEMFRTLKKHEIILNDVLVDVIKCIVYICNTFGKGYHFDDSKDPEIKFDDSIIEDKESQRASDRQDVTMGVMSKAEYRAKWYAEDEETAKEKIAEIDAGKPNLVDMFGTEE